MNKIELNTLTQVNNNERNFLSALNDNLKRIQAAINDTLSRSGVMPNQMEEVLDMNGKRIVNVGPAVNPTDVVTRQDIQNIIDAANAAIAQLDRLVEDGKIALMTYASEYIYPTCTAAVDACQLAQRKAEDAQGAAEDARDALLLNADYQAIVANLTTILALVNDIANLDAIAADLTNIDTVAGISSAVSAVAANETNINAVNANKTNIDTVAGDKANIDTVAGNTSNINTVAGISSAVTTLAGISATLTALNNNLTAINGVYDDLSKIESVYTALPEVEAVSDALSDIGAVADALTDISSVAAALTTLATIEDNLTTLLAVGADLTNLDSIAADLTNLDSIANNLTEILLASTYASQAAASASNAQIWAEGTDQQVVPLGGQHSAKVWAQYIEEIIAGTRIYGGTFDSTTATATLTSSAKAKLGVTSDTIVLTNDSTAITGYAANEGIEYYVAVEGTFASLTLHEGDILWSTGSAWKKIDNAATEIPDATESVKGIAYLASTAEAEAGANDTKIMTPLKTKQAIEYAILKGATNPTVSTSGYIGQRYLNTTSKSLWTCTDQYYTASTDYTTVGSISVSSSWIASGFNASNYLSKTVNHSSTVHNELITKIYVTTLIADGCIAGCAADMPIGVSTSRQLGFWDGYPWTYGATQYALNTWIWVKFVQEGTSYKLYGLVDNGYTLETLPETSSWTLEASKSSNKNFFASYIYLGRNPQASYQYLGGSMDLTCTAIYSSGNQIWRAATPATVPQYVWTQTQDKMSAGTGISISNNTISTDALRNTATGSLSLSIAGTGTSKSGAINIGSGSSSFDNSTVLGNNAKTSAQAGVAVGRNAESSGTAAIALGYNAKATATNAIQLGVGTNSTASTLQVGSYQLMDSSGKVPTGRYIAMTGADGTNAGAIGAVPAPAATDNTKFLRGDGTWGDALRNTATGTNSLTIGGTATNATASVNIGIGSAATGSTTVAIGQNARSTATQAYEIGTGTNSDHHTLRIGFYLDGANVGYTLLDGNTGKVPTGRYIAMTGADGTNAGTLGAVPAPAATDNTKFLRGDGTWAEAASEPTYDSSTGTVQL